MHVTITINGQEYELQITARKVINGGRTSLSMDDAETSALLNGIAEELRSILCAVDYASEQREYEASYESDEESRLDGKRNRSTIRRRKSFSAKRALFRLAKRGVSLFGYDVRLGHPTWKRVSLAFGKNFACEAVKPRAVSYASSSRPFFRMRVQPPSRIKLTLPIAFRREFHVTLWLTA